MKIKLFTKKYSLEGDLQHSYSPLQNLKLTDGSLVDFNTDELSVSLNNPLNIECQPSYDGTVNLIINDDINPPRIVNSRFTKIEDGRYRIINRNQIQQTNIYEEGRIDLQTRLFRNIIKFPKLDFVGLNYTGKLKGGNYTFYIKYADSDDNESDIICESGQISIFKGNLFNISSISGTLLDEETDKSIKLKLSNIDTTFSKIHIYYNRESSDLNGMRISEFGKLSKSYDITGDNQFIIISGFEDVELLTIDDLNIKYNLITNVKTQAQVQNILFFGNIQGTNIDIKNLQNISYFFKVKLQQKSESIGWIDPTSYESSDESINSLEYYDPKNIYYNLGYWPGELYRLGVVYIMNDDSLSPVFNLRGCAFDTLNQANYDTFDYYNEKGDINYIERDTFLSEGDRSYSNSLGVFKNPNETNDTCIQKYSTKEVKPWYYEISLDELFHSELLKLGVKGYFFVRQKRIPLTLCQGLSIGIDQNSGIPALYDSNTNSYMAESFLSQYGNVGELTESINDHLVYINQDRISGSGLYCLDASVNANIQSQLNGSEFSLQKTFHSGKLTSSDRRFTYIFNGGLSNNTNTAQCIYIPEDISYKYLNNYGFSTRIGSDLTVKEFGFFGAKDSEKIINPKIGKDDLNKDEGYVIKNFPKGLYSKLIRGIYGPFIGVCGNIEPASIYNIKVQNYSSIYLKDYMTIRGNDNSPFYAISERFALKESNNHNIYRGDCFTNTVTIRINRNFTDPDLPINDSIIDSRTWINNYAGLNYTPEAPDVENKKGYGWLGINRADVNAVPLGMWITYKCLSSYNLGLRSENTSHSEEQATFGNARGFYPLHDTSIKSAYKINESFILNQGYSATVGQKWNTIVSNVPYIKDQFDNRIMFSNVYTEDNFKNGYRIFQGLSYKDIDRQYGAIVKLLPWGTNLLCVFEKGLGIIPINEKALIQTSTNQPIHMYGAGVIQNQISLISPDYGSIWPESIVRTPIGVYGVDTYAKKIWRYSDKNGLELLSDLKIQRFLNEHLKLSETDKYPIIGLKNVKTHYNNYKGDVMFTFYNDSQDELWNFCFNERMNEWVTRYSWTPLYSENIDNIFYSLDRERSKLLSYVYDNRNCSYGIRSSENLWISETNFESNISFIGNTSAKKITFKIKSIDTSYLNDNDEEIKVHIDSNNHLDELLQYLYINSDNKLIGLYDEVSEWFNKYYNINIPIYFIINVDTYLYDNMGNQILSNSKFINKIGIILKDDSRIEEFNELLQNGFYIHGRAGVFNELNYQDNNLNNQILPTKWYNKQEPFEFEFVVNGDDIGIHKIFNNLVIISNNVEPSELEFSIIGDVYDFNKEGIFKQLEFQENEWNFTQLKSDITFGDYKVSQSFQNCTIEWDSNENNYWIKLNQPVKNIKNFGRLLGNIHYKEDSWFLTIDPILFKNKYLVNNEELVGSSIQSSRLRDKFIKIRVKYSGKNLVIITALKTLLTISYS